MFFRSPMTMKGDPCDCRTLPCFTVVCPFIRSFGCGRLEEPKRGVVAACLLASITSGEQQLLQAR